MKFLTSLPPFIKFFNNHGLLTFFSQPQWFTVEGGSKVYVKKMTDQLKKPVQTNMAITNVKYLAGKVKLTSQDGAHHIFDKVIFAIPADAALAMIESPTTEQHTILSMFEYSQNQVYLHADSALMPKQKALLGQLGMLERSKTLKKYQFLII